MNISSFIKIDKHIARQKAKSTISRIEKQRKEKMNTVLGEYVRGKNGKIRRFIAKFFNKPDLIITYENAREHLVKSQSFSDEYWDYISASIYGYTNYDTAKQILLLINNSMEEYIYITSEDLKRIS